MQWCCSWSLGRLQCGGPVLQYRADTSHHRHLSEKLTLGHCLSTEREVGVLLRLDYCTKRSSWIGRRTLLSTQLQQCLAAVKQSSIINFKATFEGLGLRV